MTANAGELINLAKEKLPISSISVFVTGFIKEQVKIENNLFKYFKITVSEFIGGNNNLGKNFVIKCRYLILDERIDKKVKSTRRNSCLMIIGELVLVDSEFLIDIQDINFLSTSNANIETLTNNSTSSSYTWTTDMPTGSDGVGQCPSQIGRTGTVRDIVPMSLSQIVPINSLWWDSVPSKFCLSRTGPIVPGHVIL